MLVQHKLSKMAVWADNIKFVREIIETKFTKIDNSVAEVSRGRV